MRVKPLAWQDLTKCAQRSGRVGIAPFSRLYPVRLAEAPIETRRVRRELIDRS